MFAHEDDRDENVDVAIFHNIMWSKYKGSVFTALHGLTKGSDLKVSFTQIAETESDRVSLGGVDMGYHGYPYELIFPGPYSDVSTARKAVALFKRAWRTKAELVVLPGYERVEFWAMLLALMLRKKPRAVFCDSTARDQPRSAWKTLAKRAFFSQCDGFFCYGIRSREYLRAHGVPEERIFFRCQAAALPHNYDEKNALALRAAHAPAAGDTPCFIYVGRLSHEKGLNTLLEAMRALLATHPNSTLRLIGSGALKSWLERRLAELELTGHVELAGSMPIEHLSIEYASATALVLASTSEPWGLVVNEALSHGCPSIVSDACGCVPELIVDGETGLTFETGNAKELASKMGLAISIFQGKPQVGQTCIEHMRLFSPGQAAMQIEYGARKILGQENRVPERL